MVRYAGRVVERQLWLQGESIRWPAATPRGLREVAGLAEGWCLWVGRGRWMGPGGRRSPWRGHRGCLLREHRGVPSVHGLATKLAAVLLFGGLWEESQAGTEDRLLVVVTRDYQDDVSGLCIYANICDVRVCVCRRQLLRRVHRLNRRDRTRLLRYPAALLLIGAGWLLQWCEENNCNTRSDTSCCGVKDTHTSFALVTAGSASMSSGAFGLQRHWECGMRCW